jgi:D-arabinose 1-dehydrogenase-like Zn-dependent alcohol dehydrogenase
MSVLPKKFTVYKGSPSKEIVQGTTFRDHLDKDQVLIKVTHSGLCGSDHVMMVYPVVLGHEGIGTIAQIGSDVKDVKVGDRVGWGYQQDVRLPSISTT